MKRFDDLRMKVPWLNRPWFNEQEDLREQGDPETATFIPSGGTLIELKINGFPEYQSLGIKEDCDGQPVSCIDIHEAVVILSNPRRYPTMDDMA